MYIDRYNNFEDPINFSKNNGFILGKWGFSVVLLTAEFA
jgi:hypothetical protein